MNREQRNYAQVATLLGKAFIRLPRKILNKLTCPIKKERDLAKMYVTLIIRAFYVDGTVILGKYRHICRRGEYMGTYHELSELTCISIGSVGYYLKLLAIDHLIVVNAVTGGTRIGICGYDYFSGYELETDTQQRESEPSCTLADIERKMGGRSMQDAGNRQERSDV